MTCVYLPLSNFLNPNCFTEDPQWSVSDCGFTGLLPYSSLNSSLNKSMYFTFWKYFSKICFRNQEFAQRLQIKLKSNQGWPNFSIYCVFTSVNSWLLTFDKLIERRRLWSYPELCLIWWNTHGLWASMISRHKVSCAVRSVPLEQMEISLIEKSKMSLCCTWQPTAAGRCRRSVRPKHTRWCSRKPHLSSTSTNDSSPASTLLLIAWIPLTSTPSPSGTLAASLVRAQTNPPHGSSPYSKCSLSPVAHSVFSHSGCLSRLLFISVALNYQSEGRVLQLNRAKFYSNGNCGYVLKPACMCEGQRFSHITLVNDQ